MAFVKVDFSSPSVGNIRPLHGVNSGPMTKVFTYDARALFRECGFPFARLHDVEYPYGSGEFVDIPCIFKDFDADETLEESYNFGLTDEYIRHIIEVGSKPIFRLGVSIEHAPVKRYIYPPKDYLKWSRICEHIIRHYNEGWANGYHWDIEYWEIWNEADGGDNMWLGSPEDFYELYCVSATYLKERFPHLKIGGCAFTRPDNVFSRGFFDYITAKPRRIPLDFYSWHKYFTKIEDLRRYLAQSAAILEEYGYSDAENVFDEWNYMKDWGDQFDSYVKLKNHIGAAYCAATLCTLQTESSVDLAAYFEADVVKEWCGIFEVVNMAIGKRQKAELGPRKPFYSFKYFNALYGMKNEKSVEKIGEGIYACAAANGDRAGLMIANYRDCGDTVKVELSGLPTGGIEVLVTDKDRTNERSLSFEGESVSFELQMTENSVVYVGTPIDGE